MNLYRDPADLEANVKWIGRQTISSSSSRNAAPFQGIMDDIEDFECHWLHTNTVYAFEWPITLQELFQGYPMSSKVVKTCCHISMMAFKDSLRLHKMHVLSKVIYRFWTLLKDFQHKQKAKCKLAKVWRSNLIAGLCIPLQHTIYAQYSCIWRRESMMMTCCLSLLTGMIVVHRKLNHQHKVSSVVRAQLCSMMSLI